MKKYFATALTLLGAIALMLAGMYVYSQPDSGGDETLVTKNIIVGSVEIESRGGDSFYVLRDKFGSEYIFNRLPVLISSGTGGSGPELAHVMGAVIITAGFLLLWLFVRRVIRIASEKNKKKDG